MALRDVWKSIATPRPRGEQVVEMEVEDVSGDHLLEVDHENSFRETHYELWGSDVGEREARCALVTQEPGAGDRGDVAVYVVEADGMTVRRQVGTVSSKSAGILATDVRRAGGVVTCNGRFSRSDPIHVWRTEIAVDLSTLHDAANRLAPASTPVDGVAYANTADYGNLWLTAVGEQHHLTASRRLFPGQVGLIQIAGELIREPDNPHDSSAIAVHAGGVGRVAYLKSDEAALNAPLLDDRGGVLPVGIRLNRNSADHHWAVIAVTHGKGSKIAVPKRRKSLSFPEAG